MNVAFTEQESHFTSPYLQDESSIIEDKDGNFLLDPSSLPMASTVPLSKPKFNHFLVAKVRPPKSTGTIS